MSDLETSKNGEKIGVSVIIPCGDCGEFIFEAISSVQSCQEDCYEIVIVNEGSAEPLIQKILNYLKEKGYQVIEGSDRDRQCDRNSAIEKAKGQYILPLDADNKIRADYITKAIDILDKYPDVGVVYGNAELFGEKTGIVEVPDFDVNKIVMGNYINGCAVFRKVVWQECGGYDPKISNEGGYQDWDFWLTVAEKGWKFYHLPEVLFDCRVRPDSMAERRNVSENCQQMLRYISTKHLELYTTNFAIIFADKEFQLLNQKKSSENWQLKFQQTEAELERWKSQLQQTQAKFYQSQTKLEKTKDELEYSQSQLLQFQAAHKQTNLVLEQTHTELARIYAAHDRTCLELAQIHATHKQTCEELALLHATYKETCEELALLHSAHDRTCSELELLHSAHDRTCEELALLHSAHDRTCSELGQAYNLLERTQEAVEQTRAEQEQTKAELARSQTREQQTQAALKQSHNLLAGIQSSKFWKIRTFWFTIKKMLKLATEDG